MRKRVLLSLFVLVLVVTFGGWACLTGSQFHQAKRSAKQVADDIHEFAVTITQVCAPVAGHCTGNLSDQEAIALAGLASDASRADDEFEGQLNAAGKVGGSNSQVLIAAFDNLNKAVGRLNAEGVLHLKNPDAQKTFNQIYNAINTAVVLLENIVTTPTKSGANHPFMPMQEAAIDPALAITAALSLLRLIAQFKMDGQLSDEQLDAAIATENEDTRKIAGDLIKALTPPTS